jgi:hypothetical protein
VTANDNRDPRDFQKVAWLSDLDFSGYGDLNLKADRETWIGILKADFVWAICSGQLGGEVSDRWCYPTYDKAAAALVAWKAADFTDEPRGWHLHRPSERSRPGGHHLT